MKLMKIEILTITTYFYKKGKFQMPELPEMETYKRFLNEKLQGDTIKNVEVTREKSINVTPSQFIETLLSSIITNVSRRGKHLIFHLNNDKKLLLHLMLGGWMYFGAPENSPNRTKQIIITTSRGSLFFIGLRLGYLHLADDELLEEQFAKLGPEPLQTSFTEQQFLTYIKGRKGMLKTTLVNQSFLAGIGNCYSDEICFESSLRPTRKLSELSEEESIALYNGIQNTLRRGILEGGYMDHPFFQGDAVTGSYQTVVYDRENEPCIRCKGKIIKEMVSSKKSFYCPNCQQ